MPIRILIAKTGLDGHDRGIKLIATALRSAGMEVIYLGMHQTLARIVRTARDEDVQVVGLSCHASEHVAATTELRRLLDEAELESIYLVVGGVFPAHDLQEIRTAGADLIFRVGEPMEAVAKRLSELVATGNREKGQ